MLLDKSLEISTSIRGRPPAWTPLFWPKTIKKEQMEFKTADHELTDDQLQNYGEILTKVRLKYKTAALEALKQDRSDNLDTENLNAVKLAQRIHKSKLN